MNTKTPHKILTLNFATLHIYENYLVSTINEGAIFDAPQFEQLQEIFAIYFSTKPFGYIANRVNDYTVNPVCYTNSNEIDGLVGMAVLCHNQKNYQTAIFTQPFFKRPLQAFFSIEECENWINELL